MLPKKNDVRTSNEALESNNSDSGQETELGNKHLLLFRNVQTLNLLFFVKLRTRSLLESHI